MRAGKDWLRISMVAGVMTLGVGAYLSQDPPRDYWTSVLVQLAVIVLGVPAALFIHEATRHREEEQEVQRKAQELALILTDLRKNVETNTSKVQNVMNEMHRDDSLMDRKWSELDDVPWVAFRDRFLTLCNDSELRVSMLRFYGHVTEALRFLDERFMCWVESRHMESSKEKKEMVRVYANQVDDHCRRIQTLGPDLQKKIQDKLVHSV